MAKLTKKTIDSIFNDFKDSLFITDSLEKHKVNTYDFFEYLKSNEEADQEYKKIEEYNNFVKEERIAKLAYDGKTSSNILMEMIKANNKKKYVQKFEIETTANIKNYTDEELDKMIDKLTKTIDNK